MRWIKIGYLMAMIFFVSLGILAFFKANEYEWIADYMHEQFEVYEYLSFHPRTGLLAGEMYYGLASLFCQIVGVLCFVLAFVHMFLLLKMIKTSTPKNL